MALTKGMTVDKIEIVGQFKNVQIRTATIIKEDGKEISRSFKRKIIAPGDDYSKESDEVKSVCQLLHTNEIKAAYKTHLEK